MNLKDISKNILGLVVITLTCFIMSCSDDEEFTTDKGANIYLSGDTVSFDTVFTGIGSATKEFRIYNPNNKGVRLSSVRLGSNGSSGFRINLDGQYNTQFTDVEIYHEDSLICFVEVTVNPHDSDSPILITDSLFFTLQNGITHKVFLQAYGQDIIVMKDEVIKSDTTLSATRPIVICDSLVVAKDATLTINEGTTLCFHKGAGLRVHGTLKCLGSLEKPITMRGDRTDRLFYYLPYNRMDSQWEGIYLYPESHDNYFYHCNIHGGNYGIYAEKSKTDDEKYKINSCIIHNVSGDAIHLQSTTATIVNSEISNAGGNCLTIIGGTTHFIHCTIAQFYPWDATHGSALYFSNVSDKTEYPLNLIEFKNCIITGSSSDEVYAGRMQDSDAAFNYKFYNSLVNTVITKDDEPNFTDCLFDQEDKNKSKEEQVICGDNFRIIDTDIYYYDFRLDTLSLARGLGDGSLIKEDCKTDLNGISRPTSKPDAGCYQFE